MQTLRNLELNVPRRVRKSGYWRILNGSAAVLIAVSLLACTPLSSSLPNSATGAVGEAGMRGVPYFLPQPQVQMQVWRAQVMKQVEVKTPASAPAKTTSVVTTTTSPKTETPPVVVAPDGTISGGAPVAVPGVTTTNTTTSVGAEAAPAPTFKSVFDHYTYEFKILKTTFVADPAQQFMLRYHPSIMADDEVNVKVGSDGLLTKVKMIADDKTDEFIIKLVDIAKELSKSPLLVGEPAPGSLPQLIYEATFNPFTECYKINKELKAINVPLTVKLENLGEAGKSYQGAFETLPAKRSRGFSGVAFHPVLPYTLACAQEHRVMLRMPLMLPDPTQVCTFPVGRAAFVKKVTDLNFDHGVLTEVGVNKPSEALAFLEIPLAVAKALTEIPANIFQVKIDQTKNASALAAERKKLLDAEKALRDAEAAAAAGPKSTTPAAL